MNMPIMNMLSDILFMLRTDCTKDLTVNFQIYCVGSEVLSQADMKSSVISDVTPCSQLKADGRFGGTYCNMMAASCWFILSCNPDDGGNMFLQNAGWLSTDCTALYTRRWNHSPTHNGTAKFPGTVTLPLSTPDSFLMLHNFALVRSKPCVAWSSIMTADSKKPERIQRQFEALFHNKNNKTNKLRGLSPQANYTDRATTICWRS
jgi:hypothetical protein